MNNKAIFESGLQGEALIESTVQGMNTTVFAYGQTSSGKTFTMRGNDHSPGLIPLTIGALFSKLSAMPGNVKVHISYLEIYNESINDLLSEEGKNLEVRESIQGVYVEGLKEIQISSAEECLEYLDIGERVRMIAATNLNTESS